MCSRNDDPTQHDTLVRAIEDARVDIPPYEEENTYVGGVEAMRKVAADIVRGQMREVGDVCPSCGADMDEPSDRAICGACGADNTDEAGEEAALEELRDRVEWEHSLKGW